jgi:hypothetical protein
MADLESSRAIAARRVRTGKAGRLQEPQAKMAFA